MIEPGVERAERRTAAGLWLAGGTLYLVAERVAASAFSPPYSYARNYISDLGVADCGRVFDGRAICSPLHGLMNLSFIAQGLLFFAAAIVAARSVSSRIRYAFMVLAGVHCLGISLVGLVHEAAEPASETLRYHVLGAFLAIVAGNATALVSSALSKNLGLPPIHRRVSLALPIVGACALAMLMVAQSRGTTTIVPDGVWERSSVYTITIWEMVTGVCLALTARQA